MRYFHYLPFLLLLAAVLALAGYLSSPVQEDVFTMKGKKLPAFSLETLEGKTLTEKACGETVCLVNFFASWCAGCIVEMPELLALYRSRKIKLIGIAFKEAPARIIPWLKTHGNPYEAVGLDASGRTGIAFGISGMPESFLISKDGSIQRHWRGKISRQEVEEALHALP